MVPHGPTLTLMPPLAALAPAWIGFEIVQLISAERYLGIKQIQAGEDPRNAGPSEFQSFLWVMFTAFYWIWMLAMLSLRLSSPQLIALIGISILGYLLRRSCGLKWVLVILTFEGAIRIGMLVSLCAFLWRER